MYLLLLGLLKSDVLLQWIRVLVNMLLVISKYWLSVLPISLYLCCLHIFFVMARIILQYYFERFSVLQHLLKHD
jgi:hypothetical protein